MANQDMLINFVPGEECRIAIVEDGKLDELYTERTSADLHVGNIYRGRVTNVEPSIQAAFVDFGLDRSGFLHISDLHPRFFPGEDREQTERVGHKTPRRDRPAIQQALKRGQQIPVQVLKEGLGTKGPTVSSYLSIPGRFLVMMPYMERHGVSRKIDDEEKRREMRRILDELDPPENLGFIVRTAGFGRPKSELKRDLNYLLRLWKDMERRVKKGRGPTELYVESDLIIRTLRDVITSDVKRIIVDDRVAALRAKQFLKLASPRTTTKVIHYKDNVPLFDAFDVERQIQQINARQVPLDCGGSLVIDQTEAMVAIDVNSGKFRDKKDAEQTAFLTNQDAVDEIARQLRLRDLGGLLVLDLIDMYANRHRREIERRFRENLKKDRARTKVLKISELGMLEMTRQRMRPSLRKSVYDECPSCMGTGQVLSPESVALEVMRRIAVTLHAKRVARVELKAHPDVLAMLLNRRRAPLAELEEHSGKPIRFTADASFGPDRVELTCLDSNEHPIDLDRLPKPRSPKFSREDELTVADLEELDEQSRLPSLEEDEGGEEPQAERDEGEGGEGGEGGRRKRRRRRRRRGSGGSDESRQAEPAEEQEAVPTRKGEGRKEEATEEGEGEESPKDGRTGKRRSRGRGRGRSKPVSGGYEGAAESTEAPGRSEGSQEAAGGGEASESGEGGEEPRRRRRRRRGGRNRRSRSGGDTDGQGEERESPTARGEIANGQATDGQGHAGQAETNSPPTDADDRGGEDGSAVAAESATASQAADSDEAASAGAVSDAVEAPAKPVKKKRPSRRRKRPEPTDASGEAATSAAEGEPGDEPSPPAESPATASGTTAAAEAASADEQEEPKKKPPRRSRSRGGRRRSGASGEKAGETTGEAAAGNGTAESDGSTGPGEGRGASDEATAMPAEEATSASAASFGAREAGSSSESSSSDRDS